MNSEKKVEYLIVDTSAFIRNVQLQEIGKKIITEQSVIDEITNKRQLRRLVVLPYDLKIEEAFAEEIAFVTEFSKKTGDYTSLSATDIKVIALTYKIEKEQVGTAHLKQCPVVAKTIDSSVNRPGEDALLLPGFHIPKKDKIEKTESENLECNISSQDKEENNESTEENKNNEANSESLISKITNVTDDQEESATYCTISGSESKSDYESAFSDEEHDKSEDLTEKFAQLTCDSSQLEVEDEFGEKYDVNNVLSKVTLSGESNEDDEYSDDSEGEDDDSDDDDDDGWITPGNIKTVKNQINADIIKEKPATVACMTTDFAMQNVLMQIGLNVVALDGRVIKQMRTYIFRCYACFRNTSVMTHVFCPYCGLKTLKKVAVSLNDKGEQQIHINYRKKLSARGKKFSLPTPQGGKHANNPILCADQPMPEQRVSKSARQKVNPLDDDYIAGYSPFATRDVYSRSAMLQVKPDQVKHWMKRNPNECRKKRK